jgi:hypothetical protein
LVLLGIRGAWEDLKPSSGELVYGFALRLPGEFFISSPAECIDVTDFDSRLRAHIAKLRQA